MIQKWLTEASRPRRPRRLTILFTGDLCPATTQWTQISAIAATYWVSDWSRDPATTCRPGSLCRRECLERAAHSRARNIPGCWCWSARPSRSASLWEFYNRHYDPRRYGRTWGPSGLARCWCLGLYGSRLPPRNDISHRAPPSFSPDGQVKKKRSLHFSHIAW